MAPKSAQKRQLNSQKESAVPIAVANEKLNKNNTKHANKREDGNQKEKKNDNAAHDDNDDDDDDEDNVDAGHDDDDDEDDEDADNDNENDMAEGDNESGDEDDIIDDLDDLDEDDEFPLGFWGHILVPASNSKISKKKGQASNTNKTEAEEGEDENDENSYTIIPPYDRVLRLSSASLPPTATGNTRSGLMIEDAMTGQEYCVTTLTASSHPAAALDLYFVGGNQVKLRAVGDAPIHVTGYTTYHQEAEVEEGQDDEGDFGEEGEYGDEDDEEEVDERELLEALNKVRGGQRGLLYRGEGVASRGRPAKDFARQSIVAELQSAEREAEDDEDDEDEDEEFSFEGDEDDDDEEDEEEFDEENIDEYRRRIAHKIKEIGTDEEEEGAVNASNKKGTAKPISITNGSTPAPSVGNKRPASSPALKPASTPAAAAASSSAGVSNVASANKKARVDSSAAGMSSPQPSKSNPNANNATPTTTKKVQCSHEGCGRMFNDETAMKQHFQSKHSANATANAAPQASAAPATPAPKSAKKAK